MPALSTVLATALGRHPRFAGVQPAALEKLPQKGIAHIHFRVHGFDFDGHRPLLRVPKLSQFALSPKNNLIHQAACFSRAADSGHCPRLHDVLPPSAELPMGVLIVDEIAGVPIDPSQHMSAVAQCLAQVHALPMPPPAARPPLADHGDPVAGIMAFIEEQAQFVAPSVADPEARREIIDELDWARRFAAKAAGQTQPRSLVLTDTHPGNYLIDEKAQVWFVDLEKALYGSSAVDLAHASLFTSTTWDIAANGELSAAQVRQFYADYLTLLPAEKSAALRPWLLAMRRLTWLRTTTWSCKWAARTHAVQAARQKTEPLSEEETILQRHIENRLVNFTVLSTVQRCRAEWLGPDRLDLEAI